MKAVAGTQVIKSAYDEVADRIEQLAAEFRSGEKRANRLLVILADHQVDNFEQTTIYEGRAIEMFGFIEVAKQELIDDIIGKGDG